MYGACVVRAVVRIRVVLLGMFIVALYGSKCGYTAEKAELAKEQVNDVGDDLSRMNWDFFRANSKFGLKKTTQSSEFSRSTSSRVLFN